MFCPPLLTNALYLERDVGSRLRLPTEDEEGDEHDEEDDGDGEHDPGVAGGQQQLTALQEHAQHHREHDCQHKDRLTTLFMRTEYTGCT